MFHHCKSKPRANTTKHNKIEYLCLKIFKNSTTQKTISTSTYYNFYRINYSTAFKATCFHIVHEIVIHKKKMISYHFALSKSN